MPDDTLHMHGKSDYDEEEDYPDNPEMELSLTRNECLFIDDSLSMIIEREHGDERLGTVRPMAHTAGLPAPVNLLEKIGKAILFTTDPENASHPATITVTETDMNMLREITHSYVKIGDEPVGFNLKRKIYTILYGTEYSRDKIAQKIISQIDIPIAPLVDEDSKIKKHPEDTK